ncbi:DGQHR domain-containing protein [Vibrio crassostreae]|nr:DGQHR domain-containing protein [Vibrio crassostreae]
MIGATPRSRVLHVFFVQFNENNTLIYKMNNNEISLKGLVDTNQTAGISRFQAFISVSRLLKILPEQVTHFDFVSGNFLRSVNVQRQEEISKYIKQSIETNAFFDIPPVSLFISSTTKEKTVLENYKQITFKKDSAFLVEGFHSISSLFSLLGKNCPFTQEKRKVGWALDVANRNKLLNSELRVIFHYSPLVEVPSILINQHFLNVNTLDTRVYSQNIITCTDNGSPLVVGANELASLLQLDELGGVSNLNKITKSDSYVTTRHTLIHIILATLSGRTARIEKRLPTKLSDKREITPQLISETVKLITPFIQGWLSALKSDFILEKSGFQNSMQVWQALGLVIHHLLNSGVNSKKELYSAGETLSQLDYSKDALHWSECSALKKDASNTYWINATGGGRTFRDKMADYFIKTIEKSKK